MARKRHHPWQVLAHLPVRDLVQRTSLVLLATLGMALLVLSKTNPNFVASVRMTVTDALLPVVRVLASPLEAMSAAAARGKEWISLGEELQSLRAENAELRKLELTASSLEAENKALRDLVHMVPGGQARYITARMVADNAGPFMKAALISGGSGDGVTAGQAVISPAGLAGRVVEAGLTSSRVLLLTDVNSRVPVIGERSREKAILAGDNSPYPILSYLSNDTRLSVGERIVTSGDGGVFPAGIVVGEVSQIGNGAARVQPAVDYERLEYVTVVDYAL